MNSASPHRWRKKVRTFLLQLAALVSCSRDTSFDTSFNFTYGKLEKKLILMLLCNFFGMYTG